MCKVKKIVFTGAECTGKSTLTRALAKRFGEPYSNEYVREYVQRINRELKVKDLEIIGKGQFANEQKACKNANRFSFHDTNILSSILYADHYFQKQIDWIDRKFRKTRYDFYFLCQPDFPWVSDPGQRESQKAREQLQCKFEQILENNKINFIPLKGNLEQRVQSVLDHLSA